jgi:phage nucleotide-binding protein
VDAYRTGYESKKYDNIIPDNLSDLIDMWLLELDDSGKFKDFRQAYQLVYQSLKRLSRESTTLDCNTIFTAWSDNIEITLPSGEIATRLQPKIPAKILDNVCGLMNVVAYINTAIDKDGNKRKTAEVVAENVYFGDSKNSTNDNSTGTYGGFAAPVSAPAPDFAMLDDMDSQLPF